MRSPNRQPISAFAAFTIVGVMLIAMALVDLYFSSRLKADIQHTFQQHQLQLHTNATNSIDPADPGTVSTMLIPTAITEPAPDENQHEIDMVAEALNSRYMQWGAVGVMLGLFVWLVTRWAPAQERRRDEERKQQTDAFLASLERRDQRFTEELRLIRISVDAHVRDVTSATDRLSERLADQFSELREALTTKH